MLLFARKFQEHKCIEPKKKNPTANKCSIKEKGKLSLKNI